MSSSDGSRSSSEATFAMMACAHGAESILKESIDKQGWRLAFSRPGFVTAKHDGKVEPPSGIFVRTSSRSLGSIKNTDAAEGIQVIQQTLLTGGADAPVLPFEQLHVWPRDRAPIGKFDFEPGIDEVASAVAAQIHAGLGQRYLRCDQPNQIAAPGQRVLDVILVDPSHWFFGWHIATTTPTCWPGGVQPISPQYEPISRAYYKAAEAIAWSGFEMREGDLAVEVGSAPGGACGRLLELGMRVMGIDPAEMDPRIAGHPRFSHRAVRAGDLPRRVFRGAKWLLVDSNVKPDATLSTVENIVTHRDCTLHGLLITLKLGSYDRASQIDRWRERVGRWNPQEVQVRQLARNRCEVCFAVKLSPTRP